MTKTPLNNKELKRIFEKYKNSFQEMEHYDKTGEKLWEKRMIIKVKVKPNSLKRSLEIVGENEYVAHLKEPAEDDKANKELVNLLSRHFGIGYRGIRIKNPKSREKIIDIDL